MENITIVEEEFTKIPKDQYVAIASGPLTSELLFKELLDYYWRRFSYFYDAAAPIVSLESIDMTSAYFQSRYGKGEGEYINSSHDERRI